MTRQRLEFSEPGRVQVIEEPVPQPAAAQALVEVDYSAISPGTEGNKVRTGRKSLLGKARAKPEQAKQVLQMASQLGVRNTIQKVRDKLEALAASLSALASEATLLLYDGSPTHPDGNVLFDLAEKERFEIGVNVADDGVAVGHGVFGFQLALQLQRDDAQRQVLIAERTAKRRDDGRKDRPRHGSTRGVPDRWDMRRWQQVLSPVDSFHPSLLSGRRKH